MITKVLMSTFPSLAQYGGLRKEIEDICELRDFKKGDVILKEGQFVRAIPLLVNGLVKVYQEDAEGREILLYYIEKGESCVMSMTSLMKDEKSKVRAVLEKDSQIIIIPGQKAVEIAKKHPQWHTFIYDLFSLKYQELIGLISTLTFSTTAERLKGYLQRQVELTGDNVVQKTHQQIANDLGASREVISRLLKVMERDAALELKHGKIKIIN